MVKLPLISVTQIYKLVYWHLRLQLLNPKSGDQKASWELPHPTIDDQNLVLQATLLHKHKQWSFLYAQHSFVTGKAILVTL